MPRPVAWVQPAVNEAEARRRLERARRRSVAFWVQALTNCLRAGGRRALRGADGKFELIYLPCALVEVRRAPSDLRTAKGSAESGKPRAGEALRFLVDGFAETVESLRDRPLVTHPAVNRPAEFDFPLSEADTLALVRRTLTALRLSRVLPATFAPAEPFCFRAVLQYPFWIHLFRRSSHAVDFQALDAVTGNLCGETTRRAFVRALETSARPRNDAAEARS